MIEGETAGDVPHVEEKNVVDQSSEGEAQGAAASVPAVEHFEAHAPVETAPPVDTSRDTAADLPAQTQNLHITEPPALNPIKEPTPNVPITSTREISETSEKPSSFKDKLAAFNRSSGSAGPPPPLKPKPLGTGGGVGSWAWKQKQQQQQQQASPDTHTPPAQPAPTDPPRESADPASAAGGMSASDAKASIGLGGSLKERMAALAGAGAFGAAGGEKQGKGTPPVVGSKPRVWKRPDAPVAAPAVNESEGVEGQGEAKGGDEGVAGEAGEEREDQLDKERRAAIAARMARLGGRGVMGMPMPVGGVKSVVAEKAENDEADGEPSASVDDVTSPVEKPALTGNEAPETTGTTIAMPALPRKAGPPRRKAPTRTATGGSVGSASPATEPSQPPVPSLDTTHPPTDGPNIDDIASPTTEGDDGEIPLPKTQEEILREREFEEAGAGPHGAEGALAAGIALAPSDDAKGEQAREVPPNAPSGGDDREIPLPRTEGEIAREHVYEEAGKGMHAADGAKAAGIAMVNVPETGEEATDVLPSGSVTRGLHEAHHERSLPPPPPPADDDDDEFGDPDDFEQDEDDDAGDDILKQAASGGLLGNSTGPHQEPSEEKTPVGFQPLQSPAPITPMARPPSGGPSGTTPHGILGLPKDEVALKHEADAMIEDNDDDDAPPPPPRPVGASDESERIKPAGPRPLPASPGRALPQLQTAQPMAGASITSPSATTQDVAEPEQEEVAPPPPRRQASVRSPVQASVPTFSGEPQTPVQGKSSNACCLCKTDSSSEPRVVVTQDPEQPNPSAEDADAARRQGIAARMAKLGGIKLGGPPMTFQRHPSSPGASPVSPSYSPRNEILASPTSPGATPLNEPSTETGDDETDEQAAKRRQATLARLRAGGALGFGMFNNGASAQEPVEASPVEASQTIPDVEVPLDHGHPSGPESREEPRQSVEHAVPETEQSEPLASPAIEEEDAPPPPPRRSLSIKSPLTSPVVPAPARMPSIRVPSRSVPPPVEDDTPEHGLAPPLPPVVVGQYVHEPETMEETQEATDEVGSPPPARTRDASHTSRSSMDRSESRTSRVSMDRSESRASRMSTTSMSSEQGMPPASPIMGSRPSSSSARPGYNDLREAAKVHGAKVARAASKLIESSKKHTIGVSPLQELI